MSHGIQEAINWTPEQFAHFSEIYEQATMIFTETAKGNENSNSVAAAASADPLQFVMNFIPRGEGEGSKEGEWGKNDIKQSDVKIIKLRRK